MTEPRDPRTDPRPGDVLRKGRYLRTICQVMPLGPNKTEMDWIAFQSPTDIRRCHVQQYRPGLFAEWAKDAEVLKRGE